MREHHFKRRGFSGQHTTLVELRVPTSDVSSCASMDKALLVDMLAEGTDRGLQNVE